MTSAMKLKIKSIFSLIFLGISALGFAQKNDFSFKRAINLIQPPSGTK